MSTRYQRWALTLAAAITTALLFPLSVARLLTLAAPTLWGVAYLAYSRHAIIRQVDIGTADTIIAISNTAVPPNQRDREYERPGKPLRSV